MQRFLWAKNALFSLLLMLLVGAVLELISAQLLQHYPDIENTRSYLRGQAQQQVELNSVPQPYLLYVPAPNYTNPNTGILQNNSDAYRGQRVPLERADNSYRVLFMGGSTTYGEGVERPEESYPARFGELLQSDPSFADKKVEVINAGLRYGTTAEIVTHYLFKFRYYRPDAVVINPGGNDPVSYVYSYYQPDYSHWRKQAPQLKALPPHARWLLNSKTLSIPIVLLFFSDTATGSSFSHAGEAMPAQWFNPREPKRLQLDELAFYNNLVTVVQAMQSDGAQVFLLSYQGNPFDEQDQSVFRGAYDHEERVLAEVGRVTDADYAPFPLTLMPASVWIDPSHINVEGEWIKARYAYEQFAPRMRAGLSRPKFAPEENPDLVLDTSRALKKLPQ